jgi:hypothetical protein
MALIHDTDDERRARVEALICELLNAQRHTSAQEEELATRPPNVSKARRTVSGSAAWSRSSRTSGQHFPSCPM